MMSAAAIIADWTRAGCPPADLDYDPDAPGPPVRLSHGVKRILPRLDAMRRRLRLEPDEPVERHEGAYWWGVVRLGSFAEARAAFRRLAAAELTCGSPERAS